MLYTFGEHGKVNYMEEGKEYESRRSRIRTAVQQLEVQIERGKLTKEIIDTMIDTVYVYDKKRIEVILRFDDVLQKVISEYMEGAKGA